MNYLFFGTPKFAAIILQKLILSGLVPRAIVCNPDRPVGRKKIITPPPTKLLIGQFDIPVLQSETPINLQSQISNLKPDLFIVAAYSQLLPKEILEIPCLGTIGVHPSLLPKYRGATPIQTAVLNGDEETGVSLFLIDEKMDHGEILASSKYQVSSTDNYDSLLEKLAELGANLLI
jgi:methionyl-tRNA formyltransferase